jgi:quercetin dioxygenase-like cupin family protein
MSNQKERQIMKRKMFAFIAGLSLLIPAGLYSQHEMRDLDEGPEKHITFLNDDVEWQKAGSLEPDLRIAILEGDPGEDGVFTLRIKIPDNGYISPHWHPNVERVTVLSGRFLLGHGEEMDKDNTMPLEEGSYTSMPPEMRHFAVAEGETIIQLTSVGPWEINYVNPQDDPRKRTAGK